MAFADFKEKLKDIESPEHAKMLQHVNGLAKIARNAISPMFEKWDAADMVFRSERKPDKEDRAAVKKGNTPKMILPLTFSQIMTFVAFNLMTLQQNARFYELQPTGTEDNPLREPMELVLERDVRRNQWSIFLTQYFLDIGRFGRGAAEVCYKEEFRHVRVPSTKTEAQAFGGTQETQTNDFQRIPVFLGNKVYNVSPYRFLPDPRLPLERFQEGEFCGSEDMFGLASLQGDDTLFNTDKIPKPSKEELEQRKQISRIDEIPVRSNSNLGATGSDSDSEFMTSGSAVVTKMVFDLVPANFSKGTEKLTALGEEKFHVRYICWVANDKTIIRFEEAYYLHNRFPYIAAQYLPDMHKLANESLADVCEQLTAYITWLANAHKASQANSLESKWVVDPAGVDIKSLESRSPYVFLRKNASQTGVDRYIKQFTTVDTTANAPAEISMFKDLLENSTGLSAFLQGRGSEGRRSATQDRAVIGGAAARGKQTLSCIWDGSLSDLGYQLLINNRQEMDLDTFARIVGQGPHGTPANPLSTEELFVLFKADPISLALSEDFFVFDGTLPSEKAFLAQSLQEVLMEMLANPVIAQVMGYGPAQFQQLFRDVYTLRGVTPSRLPAPTMPPTVAAPPPSLPVPQPAGGPPSVS